MRSPFFAYASYGVLLRLLRLGQRYRIHPLTRPVDDAADPQKPDHAAEIDIHRAARRD